MAPIQKVRDPPPGLRPQQSRHRTHEDWAGGVGEFLAHRSILCAFLGEEKMLESIKSLGCQDPRSVSFFADQSLSIRYLLRPGAECKTWSLLHPTWVPPWIWTLEQEHNGLSKCLPPPPCRCSCQISQLKQPGNKSRPNPAELIRFPEEFLKIHLSLSQPCQSLYNPRTLRAEVALKFTVPLLV